MAESLSYQQQQVANEVDQTQNLSEETKNMASFGICLSDTLMPVLRQGIDRRFRRFYEHLKTTPEKYQVNTHQNRLSADSAGRYYGINYIDSIEKNECGAHIIRDHNQLSQCFIYHYNRDTQKYVTDSHMIKYVKITDESFDATAALTILVNASSSRYKFDCFGTDIFKLVKDLKKIRNDWGHAKLSSFTTLKYPATIQKMIDLLNSLPSDLLYTPAKLEAIAKLKKWKENSLPTFVKPEVWQRILKELGDNKVDTEEIKALKSRVEDIEGQREKDRKPKDVSNLPRQKHDFCGRVEKLEQIENILLEDSKEKNIVVISGLGGIGKTAIALQIGNKLKEKFNVTWITADDNIKITSNLFELVCMMDDRTDRNIATDGDILVRFFINYIDKKTQNSLIIIDNLDTDDFPSLANKIINGRLLNNPKVSILVTSRVDKNALSIRIQSNCKFINLECLHLKEGICYMKEKLKLCEDINQSINQETAEDIVDRLELDYTSLNLDLNLEKKIEIEKQKSNNLNECALLEVIYELGGLPLALDQFAIYCITAKNRNLQTHLQILKDNKLKYSEENAVGVTTDVHKARLNVKTTWLLNINPLTKENPGFQYIFDALSFLDPTCIPISILNPKIPCLPKEMVAILEDDRFIAKLCKYSLFIRHPCDTELLTVHRMVQDVIQEIVQKQQRLHVTLQIVENMLSFLFEQAREASISGAIPFENGIPFQNGLHFANEIETFRGKNVLDEEWLTRLSSSTHTQFIRNSLNLNESIFDDFQVLMASWPGKGAIWSKAPLPQGHRN